MDLLYRRYADPISFLSRMILKCNFSQVITQIWNEVQEEKIFRMYLHSFSDKSFNEYKAEILNSEKQQNTDKEEISEKKKQEIVKKSNDILKGFTPLERGQ